MRLRPQRQKFSCTSWSCGSADSSGEGAGGTVRKTALDHTKEAALQPALAGVQAALPASPA
jgi:hypothetical protein